jgi:hypothetical protein
MTESFSQMLQDLRGRFANLNRIRVPAGKLILSWDYHVSTEKSDALITVDVDFKILEKNIQADNSGACVASFLLCLSYWLETLLEYKSPVKSEIRIHGTSSNLNKEKNGRPDASLLHRRRNLFVLHEFQQLLSGRFTYHLEDGDDWSWPQRPILNSPKRSVTTSNEDMVTKHGALRERAIEKQMTSSKAAMLLKTFPKEIAPPQQLKDQLPVGLFKNSRVDSMSHWTVGGTSQVDLWGASECGKILHLFELKGEANRKVGVIPEAFFYARLLSYVRSGNGPHVGKIGCDNEDYEGYRAAKSAEKIVMWLTAPDGYHPLVYNDGDSPLRWLNNALKGEQVEFRFLPYQLENNEVQGWGEPWMGC